MTISSETSASFVIGFPQPDGLCNFEVWLYSSAFWRIKSLSGETVSCVSTLAAIAAAVCAPLPADPPVLPHSVGKNRWTINDNMTAEFVNGETNFFAVNSGVYNPGNQEFW
ncbi:hypothetical protein GWP57_08290 [Gammaproteobacteria bacterium]|nr:hypothetical protein [Gammaproteobacteria bacterium]